jgi:phospholipase C
MTRALRIVFSFFLGIMLFMQFPVQQAAFAQSSDNTGGKTPIQHLVVLLQENHTFDNYFGTYPGADGIPAGVKMPVDPLDPNTQFITPFHLGNTPIKDLSHTAKTFAVQYDYGKMDSFVYALNRLKQNGNITMGYYDGTDLPYYWNVADKYVLFDHFFSSARDGSFANHMFWVAAAPPQVDDVNKSSGYANVRTIFDELDAKGISWKFYVQNYDPTITYRNLAGAGNRESQVVWVPLLNFDRFLDDPRLRSHIVDLNQYYDDLKNGTLPAVAYITPSGASEHPPGSIQTGQRFVKTLVQELMRSQYWFSSAFLLAYDDWGGWYDHVVPPQVDAYGYGFRVPALLVSPYAKQGYIDHSTYDFTSILKFIELNWSVPSLTDRDAKANAFLDAFDFSQSPRPPVYISAVRGPQPPQKKPPVAVIYTAYAVALILPVFVLGFAIIRGLILPHKKTRPSPSFR